MGAGTGVGPDLLKRDDTDESVTNESIQSMLEMMKNKKDKGHEQQQESCRKPSASGSYKNTTTLMAQRCFKSSPSLLVPKGNTEEDEYSMAEKSIESYDCVALSSLKEMLVSKPPSKTGTTTTNPFDNDVPLRSNKKTNPFDDDDDDDSDEESLKTSNQSDIVEGCHSLPVTTTTTSNNNNNNNDKYFDTDAKSVATSTTTKKTVTESAHSRLVSQEQQEQHNETKGIMHHPRFRYYTIIFGSFFAILLLIGILVMGYLLYALRNEEDEDAQAFFTADFWKNDVKNALTFWQTNDDNVEQQVTVGAN